MPFIVKYKQDIPQNCSDCPCSVHVTYNEVFCHPLKKYLEVTDKRPSECYMIECNEAIGNITNYCKSLLGEIDLNELNKKKPDKACAICKYNIQAYLNGDIYCSLPGIQDPYKCRMDCCEYFELKEE